MEVVDDVIDAINDVVMKSTNEQGKEDIKFLVLQYIMGLR